MKKTEGSWIFLSHSTLDWTEVRRVRNLLEEKGHRPLVFFLKCLSDHGEVIDLIRREIEARSWFLLCNSHNALNSSYVQEEVAYIKALPGKYHEEIDLGSSIETQVERIDRLCKRLTVYLSYSSKDAEYAGRINDALVGHEYNVWFDQDMLPGTDFLQEIQKRLDEAINQGFVIFLLSPQHWESRFCLQELNYALSMGYGNGRANIIPVILNGTFDSLPNSLKLSLSQIQVFEVTSGNFEGDIATLVQSLKSRNMD